MPETVNPEAVRRALERAAARMVELHDRLNQLDAAMGDGDTGISVRKAGAGLRQYLAGDTPRDDIGALLTGAGMAVNRAASSTMGTLLATALLRAGREARGQATLDGAALTRMLEAADRGIQERGKARPGDKTIVDALHPGVEAFTQAIAEGAGPGEAGARLLAAARAGSDAAIPLRSRVGRAGWVGERTEGQPDPGTVLFVELCEAVLED